MIPRDKTSRMFKDAGHAFVSFDFGDVELRAITMVITPSGAEPVRGYTPRVLVDGDRRLQAQAMVATQALASRTVEAKPLTSPKAVAEARRAALLGKRGRW